MSLEQIPEPSEAFAVIPFSEEPAVQRRTSHEPASSIGQARWYQWNLGGRIRPKHLVNFCRQFANYLDAGINLNRALESLRRQYEQTALGPVIGRIQLAVRRGEALTDALIREPAAFDYFFLSMMRLAEVRGTVPETLRMLSVHIDARERLIRQTKSALVYPSLVILLSIAVVLMLTILVLPPLVAVMADAIRTKNVDLPGPTRFLIGLSRFIEHIGWWAIPLTLFVTVFGLIGAYRLERGKAVLDVVLYHLPILGMLVRWIDTARFCRSLSALLDGGVDIGTSLNLTADTLLLVPLRRAVVNARQGIMSGETLSASIELSGRFPMDLIAIMNSGEETGRLPEMLLVVADEYEERVEFMVKNLGSLLQPVITLSIGGVVFFISAAFFMGYASLLSTLGTK